MTSRLSSQAQIWSPMFHSTVDVCDRVGVGLAQKRVSQALAQVNASRCAERCAVAQRPGERWGPQKTSEGGPGHWIG